MTDLASRIPNHSAIFSNRLAKRYRHLKKWADKNDIGCFRLYDRDIPEIPLAADIYRVLKNSGTQTPMSGAGKPRTEHYVKLYLYKRPYEVIPEDEEAWLDAMKAAAAQTLNISQGHIFATVRKRQKGKEQYSKQFPAEPVRRIVSEQGVLFLINLNSYLDTGLFFDHRPLRARLREQCAGKSVLNLFCYTGSFSVYAAAGGASGVDSVDTSKTYLSWAKENLRLNGFVPDGRFRYIKADALRFLEDAKWQNRRWDYIILDPPTFSNSHTTSCTFDINRDWLKLAESCLAVLKTSGTLYFSTNSCRFKFEGQALKKKFPNAAVTDITADTIPEDYRSKKPHRCWKLTV